MNDSIDELNPARSAAPAGTSSAHEAPGTAQEQLLGDLDAAMHRLGRLMAARHTEFQHESGLATTHYMVLKTLALSGPQRVSDLAGLLGVKNPAASMLVQQLEHDGLVSRHHDAHDNRVVIVSMTETGLSRLAESETRRRALMRTMTADLSESDLAALARILVTISETLASGA